MNSFTKEELEYIVECLNEIYEETEEVNLSILLDKIESMIDNYCEHEVFHIIQTALSKISTEIEHHSGTMTPLTNAQREYILLRLANGIL